MLRSVLCMWARIQGAGAPAGLTLPLYVKHLHGVWTREGRSMDPLLPLLVISTFAFAILAGSGLI